MQQIATFISQSFELPENETASSHHIPFHSVHSLRRQYLRCIDSADRRHQFVQECQRELGTYLTPTARVVANDSDISVSFWCAKDETYTRASFANGFETIGRKGTILIHDKHINTSRIHALLGLVQHNDGRQLLVVLDWWSKFGTAIAGTVHKSVPDDYRVLIVPMNRPVVLQLSVLEEPSISLTINAPECLICLERPRTELFETCRHLVACRPCFDELSRRHVVSDCPICRRPVSAQTTRPARYELGECQTCNIEMTDNWPTHLEKEVDALQSTVHQK